MGRGVYAASVLAAPKSVVSFIYVWTSKRPEGRAPWAVSRCVPAPSVLRACLKILSDAVFRWDELIMNGYAGGRKRSFGWQTTTAKWFWRAKTLRAAWLLALDFVVAGVTARCGDAPPAPPRPKPKSTAAASLTIFRQALSNAIATFGDGYI